MSSLRVTSRAAVSMLGAGLVLGLAGCNEVPSTSPDPAQDPTQFANEIALEQLRTLLEGGESRIEVDLVDQGLVASRVRIKAPGNILKAERLESRVTAFTTSGGDGHLTLELGGIGVTFGEATRFTRSDGSPLSYEAFVASVATALADGTLPAVTAERTPGAVPASPSERRFEASVLVLRTEGRERSVALNMGVENLRANPGDGPDGWIEALGLQVALRLSDGTTTLEEERSDLETEEFRGTIVSVDLDEYSFTLDNGTVVRISQVSFVRHESDDEYRVGTLEHVVEAMRAGYTVCAAGVGIVIGQDPLTLIALKAAFELKRPPLMEFRGLVESVDLEAQSFKLDNGTIVNVTEETHIRFEWYNRQLHPTDIANVPPRSLAAVAEALRTGHTVGAAGVGVVESEEPLIIVALKVAFFIRPPDLHPFRGTVKHVFLDRSAFELHSGLIVIVTEDTKVWFDIGDHHRLGSLEDVARALEARRTVVAVGVGIVADPSVSTDRLTGTVRPDIEPRVLVALKVAFIVGPPDILPFHGIVSSVDLESRSFTLQNGTVVKLANDTHVWWETDELHMLRTLEAVARAIEQGLAVVAAGAGVVVGTEPLTLLARKVMFVVAPPGIRTFEGILESVDPEAMTFKLHDGPTIRIVEGTVVRFSLDSDLEPKLENVALLLEMNEIRIHASGIGLLETSDPLVLIAIVVTFGV